MPESLIFTDRPRHLPGRHPLRWLPVVALVAAMLLLILSGSGRELFVALNGAVKEQPELFWSCVTLMGSGAGTYALLAPTLVRFPRLMAAALFTGIFGAAYTHLLKPLVHAARPAAVLAPNQIHVIGEVLTSNSFPSGHSVTAFAFASTLIFFSRRPWQVALIALPAACLIAFSRIAVGAHWPIDVLAGALGGWISGMAGEALSRHWHNWEARGWRIFFGIAMTGLGIGLYLSDQGYPLALPLQNALAALAFLGGLVAIALSGRRRRDLL
ncbi:phosphatase PAP2 family protein [Niveibacterium terrae]|uniref:phosphatase PAP2 family protein n=1 Tax=Niveibacterium terrae TaxID=3373598 RepID=UPI003A95A314